MGMSPVRTAILRYLGKHEGWTMLKVLHEDVFEGYTLQNTYYHCCQMEKEGLIRKLSQQEKERGNESNSYILTSKGKAYIKSGLKERQIKQV